MKDLGKAHIVLGMRILREGRKLTIDQSRYAAEIVAEFYYEDGLIFSTPMDPHAATILETDPGKELMEAQLNTFLRLLGKLNWLCHTRPDVVFSVHKIQSNPDIRIMRYKDTPLLRILLSVPTNLRNALRITPLLRYPKDFMSPKSRILRNISL